MEDGARLLIPLHAVQGQAGAAQAVALLVLGSVQLAVEEEGIVEDGARLLIPVCINHDAAGVEQAVGLIPLSSGYVAVQLHRLPINRQCLSVSAHLAQSQTGVEQVVSLLALRVGQLTVQFQDLPECGQRLVVPARLVQGGAGAVQALGLHPHGGRGAALEGQGLIGIIGGGERLHPLVLLCRIFPRGHAVELILVLLYARIHRLHLPYADGNCISGRYPCSRRRIF